MVVVAVVDFVAVLAAVDYFPFRMVFVVQLGDQLQAEDYQM